MNPHQDLNLTEEAKTPREVAPVVVSTAEEATGAVSLGRVVAASVAGNILEW
jgi:hypothetical protein